MPPPNKEQSHYLVIANVTSGDAYYSTLFDKNVNTLIEHVTESILNAENGVSGISLENSDEIFVDNSKTYSIDLNKFTKLKIKNELTLNEELLQYPGMTGTKTRHFYNNICNLQERKGIPVKYLEIGTWYGSSSIAAMFKNHIEDSLFIDNWAQFGGYKSKFLEAMSKYKSKTSKYSFIENDCWKVDTSTLPQKYFNIYLYDGAHTELDQYQALSHYLDVLQDTFIFLVDDWNFMHARDGTFRAIQELNLTVNFRHEIFISPEHLSGMPNHEGKKTFWNGCGIFVLTKPKNV
jgi:hypothetical protein